MKKSKVVILICMTLNSLIINAQSSKNESWKIIFNGKDFSGWSIIGSFGKAWIQDSAINCHMVSNTPEHTFVRTNKKYKDFILEADCKMDGFIHSGFLLRCVDAPDTAKVCIFGYQVKMDPTDRKWSGGIFDDFGNRFSWWYTLANDARAREAFKMDEWNHFRMEAISDNLKVWVNGIPTCNLINSKYKKGYIALKIHSLGNNPEREKAMVYFKNIKIISKSPEKYLKQMDLAPKAFN